MTRTVVVALACAALVAGCSATDTGRAGNISAPAQPTHSSSAPTAGPTPSVAAKTIPNPCRHNARGQLVKVSLPAQHLWMCKASHVAHETAITSGMVGQYTHTPTGHYRVQALDRNQVLTLISGQQYTVKYWIPFDAPLFGFHDASWQTFPFGSGKYRKHGSHGCVHMPARAIATLYHWAHVGTRVVIRK